MNPTTYRLIPASDYWAIVSDEEIKVDDGVFDEKNNRIFKTLAVSHNFYSGFFKVIAQSRQVHEGIDLFDLPAKLDGMLEPATFAHEACSDLTVVRDRIVGIAKYIEGYNAAKEKYRFTEQQLRKAIQKGIHWSKYHAEDFEVFSEAKINDFIQSLSQPKQYQVELEMEEEAYHYVSGGLQPLNEIGGKGLIHHEGVASKPKLNSEGRITIKSYKEV